MHDNIFLRLIQDASDNRGIFYYTSIL